jgi:hypothetical protein
VREMSTVQEIERAIAGLAPPELKELYSWMDERVSDAVDAKMKADLDAGVFDGFMDEALAEEKAGSTRSL